MAAITVKDLDNAKRDVDHIAEVATSTALTATDRMGNTKDTVAGAVYKIGGIINRGPWAAGTAYASKDIVLQAGTWYICTIPHTSSASFAADAANWTVYQGVTAADIGASSGSSMVGFQQAGAGAVPRTVQDELRDLPISPRQFGYVGGRDETASLQKALDACPAGGTVSLAGLPACTISAALTVVGKSIRIDWAGVAIQQTAAARCLDYDGGLAFTRTVTATDPVTRHISFDTTGVAVGDVLKLVSDDRLDGTRPADAGLQSRRGQYVTVSAIDGTGVVTAERFRYAFTTAPRISKLNRVTLRSERSNFSYAPAIISSNTCVSVTNGVSHVIDAPHFGRLPYVGIALNGCFGYTVNGGTWDKSPVSPNGHGISDWSCVNGVVMNPRSSEVRHLFTTNQEPVTAGDARIQYFGPSYNFAVYGAGGGGVFAAVVDTHHGAEDGLIVGALVADNNNDAVGLRGRRITFVAPNIRNAASGVLAYSESDVAEVDWSEDITIVNLRVTQTEGSPLRGQRVRRLRVDSPRLHCTAANLGQFIACDCDVYNATMEVQGTAEADTFAWLLQDASSLRFHGKNFLKINNHTGTNYRLFAMAGTGRSEVTGELEVEANATANLRIVSNGATLPGYYDTAVSMVSGPASILLPTGTFEPASRRRLAGVSGISQRVTGTATAGGVIGLNNSGDPVVMREMTAAGPVTIGGLDAGKFDGQLLILRSNTTNAISIPNGAGSNGVTIANKGSATVTLPTTRDTLTYMWATTQWDQV